MVNMVMVVDVYELSKMPSFDLERMIIRGGNLQHQSSREVTSSLFSEH